jgi:hypothetical protein
MLEQRGKPSLHGAFTHQQFYKIAHSAFFARHLPLCEWPIGPIARWTAIKSDEILVRHSSRLRR